MLPICTGHLLSVEHRSATFAVACALPGPRFPLGPEGLSVDLRQTLRGPQRLSAIPTLPSPCLASASLE